MWNFECPYFQDKHEFMSYTIKMVPKNQQKNLGSVTNFKDDDGGRMDGMTVLNRKVPLMSGVRRSSESTPMT
jgi:hypothetical protein